MQLQRGNNGRKPREKNQECRFAFRHLPCTHIAPDAVQLSAFFAHAGSGSRLRFFCEFFTQKNKLPHVMIGVSRASEKNHEAFRSFRFAFGRIRLQPIRWFLLSDCRHDHRDGLVESVQHCIFFRFFRFRELAVAVANVAGTTRRARRCSNSGCRSDAGSSARRCFRRRTGLCQNCSCVSGSTHL